MSQNKRSISFICDMPTTRRKGIEFLYALGERHPNHKIKMLSNVEQKRDYFFKDTDNLGQALEMFQDLDYTSAFLRDEYNSCSFNPFHQHIEVMGDEKFFKLCQDVWQKTFDK